MNFDELDKQYSYYNNNDYKKYIADDVYMCELIRYLAKNRQCIRDVITFLEFKSKKKKKCKFLKCYCNLKNNIIKSNRDKIV